MRINPVLYAIVFALLGFAAATAANPVPLLHQPLSPSSVRPGSGAFTLYVYGANFVQGCSVTWNGAALDTVFVSTRQLRATVPAANVAAAGAASVQVANPAPKGGPSNAVIFEISPPTSKVAFAQRTQILLESFAFGVVTADFNKDGKLDVATANSSNTVSILLGNGDGTFQSPVNYSGPTGAQAFALVAGDFNNDGNLDLAVAATPEAHPGFVYILLGNGDGTFQPPGPELPITSVPRAITAADLNRDGNLDLAVTNANTNTVSVFLGNFDGTFGMRTDFNSGSEPFDVLAADLNNDGIIDLAIADLGACAVQPLLGVGDGTFTLTQSVPEVSCSQSVAGGDMNGDGLQDLIVADGGVGVALGSGGGMFQSFKTFSSPQFPLKALTGDFNNDSKLDALGFTVSSPGIMFTMLGDGAGNLIPAQTFSTVNSPQTAALGDFNGDGRLDAVVAGAALSVMLQTELLVTPQVESFGDRALGTTSGEHPVNLTNIGSTPLGLGTITVSGVNRSEFALSTTCLSTLQPSHTCVIRVTFSPATEGLRSATLEIPNLSEHFTQTVSMSGIGTIADVSPRALSFGSVQVGKASSPQTVTLKNVGSVALHIAAIQTVNTGDFLETNNCSATLAPAASCTVNVTFEPVATGARVGTLMITDDGGGSPQHVHLSGTGI
jgi:hypothetical protein